MPTIGKQWLLARRRRGLTQAGMAMRLGVPLSQYRRWEQGTAAPTKKCPPLGALKPHEECLLRRLDAGLTQAQVAAEYGCCVFWLRRMEHGELPCKELLEWWNDRG